MTGPARCTFVELTKATGKKFTAEALFPLAVAEAVERFKIALFLVAMVASGTLTYGAHAVDGTVQGCARAVAASFFAQADDFLWIWGAEVGAIAFGTPCGRRLSVRPLSSHAIL